MASRLFINGIPDTKKFLAPVAVAGTVKFREIWPSVTVENTKDNVLKTPAEASQEAPVGDIYYRAGSGPELTGRKA